MPKRSLTVYYTSDIHGCFPASAGQPGLASLAGEMRPDGNTLLLDGGDLLQGSPFSRYLEGSGHGAAGLAAGLMNLAGYSFVTLGNHDFSYGKATLEAYISALDAVCLCANVTGVKGTRPCALVTLENGLRVGLTGVITPCVPLWERAENVAGAAFTDPVEAARTALDTLKAQGAQLTVCICHMGFERDPVTGQPAAEAGENRAYEIAAGLGFSLVLAGHTHAPFAGGRIGGSFACAPADKAQSYIRCRVREDGVAEAELLKTGTVPEPAAAALLAPYEKECEAFLARPIGHLRAPIEKKTFLESALHGDAFADLVNTVQLEATGADISAASLQNTPVPLGRDVSAGDILAAYPFPNTLRVLEVDRAVLKQALERSASFLTPGEDGRPAVAAEAHTPVPQFYNYDCFSGLSVMIDLGRPAGARVLSIVYRGRELPEGEKLRLVLNSYRASGAGGYPFYRGCRVLFSGQDEVQALLTDHFCAHGTAVPGAVCHTEYYIGKELI